MPSGWLHISFCRLNSINTIAERRHLSSQELKLRHAHRAPLFAARDGHQSEWDRIPGRIKDTKVGDLLIYQIFLLVKGARVANHLVARKGEGVEDKQREITAP